MPDLKEDTLIRPSIARWLSPVSLIGLVVGVHTVVRFGGLWDPRMIAASMLLLWPLPWMLSPRDGRSALGLRRPGSSVWWGIGGLLGAVALGLCGAAAFGVFGGAAEGSSNWLAHHAATLRDALQTVPREMSPGARFWVVTAPALVLSPIGEEILFRGYVLHVGGRRWGYGVAMGVQSALFAVLHLAHYGLQPFDPWLCAVWLPSMAGAAAAFGWVAVRSRSLGPAILAHSAFNLAMHALVVWVFPDVL